MPLSRPMGRKGAFSDNSLTYNDNLIRFFGKTQKQFANTK